MNGLQTSFNYESIFSTIDAVDGHFKMRKIILQHDQSIEESQKLIFMKTRITKNPVSFFNSMWFFFDNQLIVVYKSDYQEYI